MAGEINFGQNSWSLTVASAEINHYTTTHPESGTIDEKPTNPRYLSLVAESLESYVKILFPKIFNAHKTGVDAN